MSKMQYVTIHVPKERLNVIQNLYAQLKDHIFINSPVLDTAGDLQSTTVVIGPLTKIIAQTLEQQAHILKLRYERFEKQQDLVE